MPDERIVVIGASAGGVEALLHLSALLPSNFPAPLLVVVHISSHSPSVLPDLLSRRGNLPAKHAVNGEKYQPGLIYVAPPDHHLLLRDGTLRVMRGPRKYRHRPAIDPLFRSAAAVAGPRTIGVILTGRLDDGTAGLLAIKNRGGVAIVQDPADAVHSSMPESALHHVNVDFCLPLRDIPQKLIDLLKQPVTITPPSPAARELIEMEDRLVELDSKIVRQDQRPGEPSVFSCPDCGGVLWEIKDGEFSHYRCRVGHAFSPENMLSAQNEALEQALWTAMKTLEESAALSRRLAASERLQDHDWMAARFDDRERDARKHVEVIRRVIGSQSTQMPQVTDEEFEATARRR